MSGIDSITAVVVSLPDRAHLLTEALASVHAQTLPATDIIVGIDPYRLGEVANMNRLLRAVDTEWVAFLHDDDVWHPDHLAVCAQEFATADVVVSRYDLIGRPWNTIEPWHDNIRDLLDPSVQWIGSPSMVCARRSVWGDWCDVTPPYRWVDHSNYARLVRAGARFADTRKVTVDYRFGPWANGSWT